MSMRVRFAPSPTGHIHVGNARTALFNYLLARSRDAVFILRIEDTDLERSSTDSELHIYEDLRWLGITWDEGEGVGGDYGPYRQTERFELYKDALDNLLENDNAYHCFCSKEELDAKRQKALDEGRAPVYDGTCRHLSAQEVKKKLDNGEKAAIRFKIKKDTVDVEDMIHGIVSFPTNSFGDFIIVRPDGVPVYNFVVVVDDALMKITHVIRGDDHLSNTPKQILIFDALGYSIPNYGHIPMILGPDRSKLSKRHGNTSIEQFRADGYLPEAMVNFMSLLSWSPDSEQEIFTIDDVIDQFSLNRVSKSPAVFDFDKLKWMNGLYIRSSHIEKIADLAFPYMIKAGQITEEDVELDRKRLTKIIESVRDNLEVISDITKYTPVYFERDYEFDSDAREILAMPLTGAVIKSFKDKISLFKQLSIEKYKEFVKEVQKETGAKGKALFMALRVGLTGRTKGPELDSFITLMFVGDLLQRLDNALKEISK